MAAARNARVFLEDEMADVTVLALGEDPSRAATAVVYTHRAPEKTTANEDASAVLPVGESGCVLVVADGMGGRPAGEGASQILIDEIATRIDQAATEGITDLRPAVMDGIENANQKILALGVGAGATLAAVEIGEAGARTYHVGDSQIVIVGGRGKLKLQTIAHSPVGYGVEAGLIDESDALHHDERHLISNVVGAADMRIEVGSARRLDARDTVVVGSDGLFDNLSVAEIAQIVRKGPLDAAGRKLAAKCRERMAAPDAGTPSKPDDLTFILFRPRAARR
jgi:serine/threonine protein phosphatase PrpC